MVIECEYLKVKEKIMTKTKFEFYRGDIWGLVAFLVVYKIGSILFLILLALINGAINNPDLVNSLIGYAPLIGFILGAWAFYAIHNYYKRKSLAKKAESMAKGN